MKKDIRTFSFKNILGSKITTVAGLAVAVIPIMATPHLDLTTIIGSAAIIVFCALVRVKK